MCQLIMPIKHHEAWVVIEKRDPPNYLDFIHPQRLGQPIAGEAAGLSVTKSIGSSIMRHAYTSFLILKLVARDLLCYRKLTVIPRCSDGDIQACRTIIVAMVGYERTVSETVLL